MCFPLMSGTEDATGVIATWFIESGEEVTPTTLIAEVAMDKLDASQAKHQPAADAAALRRLRLHLAGLPQFVGIFGVSG